MSPVSSKCPQSVLKVSSKCPQSVLKVLGGLGSPRSPAFPSPKKCRQTFLSAITLASSAGVMLAPESVNRTMVESRSAA